MYVIYNASGIKLGINTNDEVQLIANLTTGDKYIEADIDNISDYVIIDGKLVRKQVDANLIATLVL
jgi:ABC-type metal ion transport system substrate-binding protein